MARPPSHSQGISDFKPTFAVDESVSPLPRIRETLGDVFETKTIMRPKSHPGMSPHRSGEPTSPMLPSSPIPYNNANSEPKQTPWVSTSPSSLKPPSQLNRNFLHYSREKHPNQLEFTSQESVFPQAPVSFMVGASQPPTNFQAPTKLSFQQLSDARIRQASVSHASNGNNNAGWPNQTFQYQPHWSQGPSIMYHMVYPPFSVPTSNPAFPNAQQLPNAPMSPTYLSIPNSPSPSSPDHSYASEAEEDTVLDVLASLADTRIHERKKRNSGTAQLFDHAIESVKKSKAD